MAVFPSRLSIDELPRVIPIQPGETACMLLACMPREHCIIYNSDPPPSLFVGMNAVEMLQAYNYNLMAAVTIESPVSYQLCSVTTIRFILSLLCRMYSKQWWCFVTYWSYNVPLQTWRRSRTLWLPSER